MTKTILAMGQSHAVGSADATGVWNFPANVKVWNNTSNIDSNSVGLGSAFVTPVISSPPFGGTNSMMPHAARYLAKLLGEDVRLILVGRGGDTISSWASAAGVRGTMYLRMQAILAAAGVSAVDAFLWHQGEGDAATPGTYAARWGRLLANLNADGYLSLTKPVVIGALNPTQVAMNAVLREIADLDARVGLADIQGFPINQDPSNLHYLGTSAVRAGLEYVRELSKLNGPFKGLIPPDYKPSGLFVTGVGNVDYSSSAGGGITKVPLIAENGKKSMISGGSFVADRAGVWKFNVQGYTGIGRTAVMLIDETGSKVQDIAFSGALDPASNTAVLSGHGVVALGEGDKISLGVAQDGGSASVLSYVSSVRNRLTVEYMGP